MKKIVVALFVVTLIAGCGGKKDNPDYSSNSQYTDMEKHEEDDGFIWYSAKMDGKTVVLDSNEIIIIEPFDGTVHYESNGRFLIRKWFYTDDRSDSCSCCGIYDKNGAVIISENKGYNGISLIGAYGTDYKLYKTFSYNEGQCYCGLTDIDGKVILEPVFEDINYDDEIPMFVGFIDDKPYYTYKYINSAGVLSSYGSYTKFFELTVDEELENGEWIDTYAKGEKVKIYVLDTTFFVKQTDSAYYLSDMFKKVGSEDDYTIYENNSGQKFFIKTNERYSYGELFTGIVRSYEISRIEDDTIEDLYVSRRDKFYKTRDCISFGQIDEYVKIINSSNNRSKGDPSYSSYESVPSVDNSGPPYNDMYTPSITDIGNTPREPIRNACASCFRNRGFCGGCDGTGKIKAHYNSTTGEWIMRDCTACRGSGICHACGGDGWLDEGVDF